MPELPELEVLKNILFSQINGKEIKKIKILKPYILKNYFTLLEKHSQPMGRKKKKSALVKPVGRILSNAHSDFLTGYTYDLSGEKIKSVLRRGKYLIIELTSYKIIIHLMLRGSIKYTLPGMHVKKSSAAFIQFKDGTLLEMNETGHKKRMSIYVLPKGEHLDKIDKLGIEPLQDDFTLDKLKNLLQCDSMQLKSFLCDQKKVAGIGNAYADEILWQAKISPFKITTKLKDSEIKDLYGTIIKVLNWAIDKVKNRGILEKRDFLNIHNKKKGPCPRCGETILFVSFSSQETFYCPKCQTKGRKLKDRRLSKFYR
jgi:formamidopyrimidine-DNA glycosylase